MIKNSDGFTMVEIAIVMIILGVLLSGLTSFFLSRIVEINNTETKQKLNAIDEALQVYLEINGRYPCVARNDVQPETANYGVEVGIGSCIGAPVIGTARAVTNNPNPAMAGEQVRIGSVPTRTLNLPDQYATDAWGRRFTYAVTEVLASAGSYNRDLGGIDIVDSNNNTVIVPQFTGHYTIVSHGESGEGAVPAFGGARLGCGAPALGLDMENCNDDDRFIDTVLINDSVGANFYDDLVLRKISNFVSIPTGAVVPFNAASCPDGWSEFIPARGRTVLGVGDFNQAYSNGPNNWNVNETYILLESGGAPFWQIEPQEIPSGPLSAVTLQYTNNPAGVSQNVMVPGPGPFEGIETISPYVALLYCERS